MKRSIPTLAAAITASFIAGSVTAETIAFSNFDEGFGFNDEFGWSAGFAGDVAMSFVAGASGDVTDLYLGLMGGFGVWADVNFHVNDNGAPGSIVGSWLVQSLPAVNSNPDPVHLTIDDSISLTTGETYWISVGLSDNAPGFGSVLWGFNTTDDTGVLGTGQIGGNWNTQEGTRSAFAVIVPAPGVLIPLAIGVLSGTGRRRKSD